MALAGQRSEEEDQIWVVPPESGATALGPAEAVALNRKGNDLQEAGDKQRALECYQRAVKIDPGCAPALQNLGYLLSSEGLTEQGIRRLEQAQTAKPEVMTELMIATALPVIYNAPADVAAWRERAEQGVQELVDRGAEIDTTDCLIPTNFYCAYQGRNDRTLHGNLGRIYKGPDLTVDRPRRERGPDDRIRVGILSAYFRNHTVGGLNIGRVERIDAERFEVVLLSIGRYDDRTARRYRATPHRFVELPGGVAEAREAIAAEDLDVLFFTEVGMNSLAYTLAFSRMAPVQCVTWGHPITTGSPYMDHFLSSDLLEVPGPTTTTPSASSARPSLCTYYERPDQPEASGIWGDLGLEADHNLYACPQTLFKFHPDFDRILGEILRRDPKGRLVLIEGGSPEWMRLLHARFARSIGDVSDRIVWLRSQPRPNYLRLLAAADVILDTTVFGGGNSSYEMLGVGTPVVTLPSEFLRCRITAALYAKAGFLDLVADSEESYIEMAVRLGTDDDWHRHVSERIEESCEVLYEDEREVRDFEEFLAEVAL